VWILQPVVRESRISKARGVYEKKNPFQFQRFLTGAQEIIKNRYITANNRSE
jgi:hypothetical protein